MKAVLLDVDGTLAPTVYGYRQNSGWPEDGWVNVDSESYGGTVCVNPHVGSALNRLVTDTGAVLYWCTTWLELPHHALEKVGDVLGIKPERFGPHEGYTWGTGTERKQKVAELVAAMADKTVWFDDEPLSPNVLQVNPALGITPQNIQQAHERLL